MIIEHSGDFKVVDPKTKEVRYDSTNVVLNLRGTSSSTWKYVNSTVALEENNWEKYYGAGEVTIKDQILKLLKGETFYDIKNMLEEVFEEVQEKAKY